MRFVAPARESIDADLFRRPPFSAWFDDHAELLLGAQWPSIECYEAGRARAFSSDGIARPVFAAQTPVLLGDGLHYEERIARGTLATREQNWHDLLNALIWLRYPRIKHALNVGQLAGIAEVGPRVRTRAQCAMTHFDEGGAIVLCSDPHLLKLWDAHDWYELFVTEREAWGRRITVLVFGHAVLEHALVADSLLVAKALPLMADPVAVEAVGSAVLNAQVDMRVAELIALNHALRDPQDLRPLPLCGIPGWHTQSEDENFHRNAPCFRPLREGRLYPEPASL